MSHFFKIPTVKSSNSDFTKERKLRARAAWIKALTKTRVIDDVRRGSSTPDFVKFTSKKKILPDIKCFLFLLLK